LHPTTLPPTELHTLSLHDALPISEASKRPVDLSTSGSSSTRQTISEEGFSVGVMRICASALFSMSGIAIIPHINPKSSAGYWTLVLCAICGVAGRRDAGALRNANRADKLPCSAHATSPVSFFAATGRLKKNRAP